MPKQTVHYGQRFALMPLENGAPGDYWYNREPIEVLPTTAIEDREPSLSIEWNRSDGDLGHVAVQIECSPEYVKRMLSNDQRLTDSNGTLVIRTLGMNRRELNELIRTARRARDAAFGTDE